MIVFNWACNTADYYTVFEKCSLIQMGKISDYNKYEEATQPQLTTKKVANTQKIFLMPLTTG